MIIVVDTKPRYRRGQLVEVSRKDVIYQGVVIKVNEINRCWDKWVYIGYCVHYPKKLRQYQNNANRYEWVLFEDEVREYQQN
ncbi:hypothetical protein NUACC21_15580 [Scytonema sp. NUACC21]